MGMRMHTFRSGCGDTVCSSLNFVYSSRYSIDYEKLVKPFMLQRYSTLCSYGVPFVSNVFLAAICCRYVPTCGRFVDVVKILTL